MICDLYAVIDHHGDTSSNFVADLLFVLPPRGHALHNLAVWQECYISRLTSVCGVGYPNNKGPEDER